MWTTMRATTQTPAQATMRTAVWSTVILSMICMALPSIAMAAPADDNAVDRAAAVDSEAEIDAAGLPVRGPSVSAVLTAAYAAAGLDRDPQGSWIRRARLAGLVPWVTVRTTRDTSWQDEHSEVGHGTSLEVRATWRLDRLLFDAKELQVAAIEAARRRERRRLANRVIREYFVWKRAAAIAVIDDRAATRAEEAAAELDALTDGWFSEQLRAPPVDGAQGSAKFRSR
jgi:hypothetical protein